MLRIVPRRLLPMLLLVGGASPAGAEPPVRPVPKRPSPASGAAEEALAASRAADAKALEVVSRGPQDPWVVATVLLEHGEMKAAAALATVALRPDTEALPGYVARYTPVPDAVSLRAAWDAAAEHLSERRTRVALEQIDALLPDVRDLLRVQVLHGRALALEGEGRPAVAAEVYSGAAADAENLGWLCRASWLRRRAGAAWRSLGDREQCHKEWSKNLVLDERRGVDKDLAATLDNLGMVTAERGQEVDALALFERGVALADRTGDRPSHLLCLRHLATTFGRLGRVREAAAAYERVLALAQGPGERADRAQALRGRALARRDSGDLAGTRSDLTAALAILEELGNRPLAVDVRLHLASARAGLGDRPGARAAAEEALSEAEALKDEVLVARARAALGGVVGIDGGFVEGIASLERARSVQEARGLDDDLIYTLTELGVLYQRVRDLPSALEARESALRVARKRGLAGQIAKALDGLASVRADLGQPERALEHAEESRRLYEQSESRVGVATAQLRIGLARFALGDTTEALALVERARDEFAERGHVILRGLAESTLADIRQARGEWALAIEGHERALALLEKSGDPMHTGREAQGLGRAWHERGDVGRALSYYESAEALLAPGPDWHSHGVSLTDLAVLWDYLGEPARSLALRERAVAAFEKANARTDVALELGAIGLERARWGAFAAAVEAAQQALVIVEASGDLEERGIAWARLGQTQSMAGQPTKALESLRKSLALREETKDPCAIGRTHVLIADALRRMGSYPEALEAATYARELLARGGRPDQQFIAESESARLLELMGRHRDAIAAARGSIGLLDVALRGLGDKELAVGWSRQASLPFAVGLEAATTLGDVDAAAWFLESARGHALLEMFAVRDTLRDAVLPPAVRAAEIDARARQTAAAAALRRAAEAGDADGYDRARASFDRAMEDLTAAAVRAERDAKRASAVARPAPATLEAIRKGLRPEDALVVYGSTTNRCVAVVVEASGARIVPLAERQAVLDACAALAPEDAGGDPAPAVRVLRGLVLEPLKLAANVRRLLVSPDDALAFVPFSLLEGEREVVLVPSATVLGLLRAEVPKRGEGVLALGDPERRVPGGAGTVAMLRGDRLLAPLPASREEAQEVGTTVLLGEGATAPALAAALAQKRWRSVHFACHGVLDAERPVLSGLALSPTGDHDGILRVLDVFRLKVDADLVVLSACETARGKVVRGEGVLGLTRAFLFAGAPRVVASLWKVDDAATRALMSAFYAQWAEGASPAAALRHAQAQVRARPGWEHPRFWAAWTLWGLGD